MEVGIIKLSITASQFVSARIIGNRNHYLNAPDEILNWRVSHYIYVFGHLLPTIVVTVILSLKLLPLISREYSEELENNGVIIPITVIAFLIPIVLLNGIIIEKCLMMRSPKYREFVSRDDVNAT
ncbi:MAG: hypothetical protein IPP71_15930 [Bacteroidetes bacterium]|nr:hypothetical protein [Bacteroidota bacterium]